MKKQLFSLLALLLMVAGSAMAQNENSVNVRELTKNAQGNWVLNQMPGWSGQLEITLREAFRLDSIPLTWTVMVAGVDKTADVTAYTAEEGPDTLGWLNVLEGDTVELVPPTVVKPTVKNVTLTDNSTPTIPAAVDLEATTTAWADGIHYAVPAGGLTYGDAVTVSGDVTLTLTEGTTLTLNKGISLAEGATLTIDGTGTMAINGSNGSTASTVAGTGTLVLTSGTLFANGGNGGGLWDCNDQTASAGGVAINGNVTVSGGTATATGGNGGGIGGEFAVNNRCGNGGAAISGNATINAGTWTATNGSNGSNTVTIMNSENIVGTGGAAVAGTVTDNR